MEDKLTPEQALRNQLENFLFSAYLVGKEKNRPSFTNWEKDNGMVDLMLSYIKESQKQPLTPELKERFCEVLRKIPRSMYSTKEVIEAMHAAYQLDRSSLFSREEVERIAEKVRDATKEAANLDYYDWDRCRISWDDIDLNQITNKR